MDKGDVVHIYNGILLSHKKERNNPICSNMDGPRDCHTEWSSQTEKDKYHIISIICEILKNGTNELFYKTKQTYGYQRGNGGRDKLGDWD